MAFIIEAAERKETTCSPDLPPKNTATLLRDPSKKKDVWEDFKQIMKLYKK